MDTFRPPVPVRLQVLHLPCENSYVLALADEDGHSACARLIFDTTNPYLSVL
jgi:hypothetical protein